MSPIELTPQPLTSDAFAPFGDVIAVQGDQYKLINEGMCKRYSDLAQLDFFQGRAGISLFSATPRAFPYEFNLLERHPLGSQAFIPMSEHPFLVIVASDIGDRPGEAVAFMTTPGQCINFHRGTWHGVLTPLHAPGLFAVIDRIGEGDNLEEYHLDRPYRVHAPEELSSSA